MRAITGAVVSSKPCSLQEACRILGHLYDSSASNLPSADCATYLLTAAEATREHELFRSTLRANQQQGAANLEAYDYDGEREHQDRERKGDTAAPTGGSHRDSAAEVELDAAAGAKKSKKKSKKKKNREDRQQGRAVACVESHIPSSPEIGKDKREEKHSIKETITHVKQEPVGEELLSEKKNKKKKEKGRVKLEEEARDGDEVGTKIVNDGWLDQNVAGGEKKRKKKKHEEEISSKVVKQEEKMVSDGDPDSEKKRKKKRGRGDNDDNMQEQVEHTKKKQRK